MPCLLTRLALAGLLLAVPSAGLAQEWPRLSDGRVVITVKGVRLALPTDYASLHEFQFGPLPDDYRARFTLQEALDNPDGARRFFDGRDDVIIHHVSDPTYGLEYAPANVPVRERADQEYIKEQTYIITIGLFARRRCGSEHSGYTFIYKNILAPIANTRVFDQTNYLACADEIIEVEYASLEANEWTSETIPIFHDNITELFNDILLDFDVRIRP